MEDQVPANLKTAAIIQIVSGLFNWFFASWMAFCTLSAVCGVLTFWMGGLGGIFGYAACLLIPIGWVEIGVGVYGLSDPKGAGHLMKNLVYLEIGSVLFGGLTSAISGVIVMRLLENDEVLAYLEG